ncbi:hypothetical protein CI793_04800 [Anoxybacillus ayderensis]|nr:hypothetical protein B379_00700 [Anoxybacillus ayderensis G10]THD17014.1 hypothetical protein CI793_04800 [Anoxybacillus ayderensis]
MNEKRLRLEDLYLGNIDAKHELLINSEDERARFSDSFFMPENINSEDYFSGQKFFVTGLKGTGKTALLRYFAIKAEREQGAHTLFILFKSEIKEQDRQEFDKVANTMIACIDQTVTTDQYDYEDIWKWFLHRRVVEEIEKRNIEVFKNDDNWKKYSICVKSLKVGDENSGIKRLFPKIRKGMVELNVGTNSLSSKLGLEFDWENAQQATVKFSNIVKQADTLFERLLPGREKFLVFLDELELTLGTTQQYLRDKKLIRDIVVAAHHLNIVSRKKGFNLHFISAIRSEVLTAVESSGKEINKIISDFGTNIVWHQSGGNIFSHPILQIITKRLAASERFHGIECNQSTGEIWNRYFPQLIQSQPTGKYILHLTWYRPRDVVRLLNLAKSQHPKKNQFTHQVFDSIRKSYSSESWTELTEELRTIYSEEEIEGIKRMFYGINSPFTYKWLQEHVKKSKEMYAGVDKLLTNHKLGEVLSNLYRVGLLGNTGEKIRFAHRGDDEILLEKKIMVHTALWPFLSISRHSKKNQNYNRRINTVNIP